MEQVTMPITAFVPEGFWISYARDSRTIEGIIYTPDASTFLRSFVESPLSVASISDYVYAEAGTRIRSEPWMNVRVGQHVAPPGGPHILTELDALVTAVKVDAPYETHAKFLHLHPFMDGNGRAARALLAWQAIRNPVWYRQLLALPVLQTIYYMGLDHADRLIDRGTFMT